MLLSLKKDKIKKQKSYVHHNICHTFVMICSDLFNILEAIYSIISFLYLNIKFTYFIQLCYYGNLSKIRFLSFLLNKIFKYKLQEYFGMWQLIWCKKDGRKIFHLTTHSTHFVYGYMASDIW